MFTSLTLAVEVGLVLAVLLFAKRMSEKLVVTKVLPDHSNKSGKVQPHVVHQQHDCPQISMYTIEGPLFFGAAQMFEQKIESTLHQQPRVLILRMGKVPFMDSTGEAYFSNIIENFTAQGGKILVTGVQGDLKIALQHNGIYDKVGAHHFYQHTGEAITKALGYLDTKKCIGCQHFAFHECKDLSKSKEEKELILQ